MPAESVFARTIEAFKAQGYSISGLSWHNDEYVSVVGKRADGTYHECEARLNTQIGRIWEYSYNDNLHSA
jgi:hypothetical protein